MVQNQKEPLEMMLQSNLNKVHSSLETTLLKDKF